MVLDQRSLDVLYTFKEALSRRDDASDSEESDIEEPTNRGNKLKRGASQVYRGKLGIDSYNSHDVKIVEYGNQKRPVIYKRRKLLDGSRDEEGEEINDLDPYDTINIEDLLSPIGHPSEVVSHPAISRTYKSNTLSILAKRALDVISSEQKHVVQFSRLMSIFLGDDPSFLLPENLNLPDYNHYKVDEDTLGSLMENNENQTDTEENNLIRKATKLLKPKSEEDEDNNDNFFGLPQLPFDPNFGISPEAAEETRQLTQIALQRNEEFIRCMMKLRSSLTHADRIRDRVFRWCKEMNGDVDDEKEGTEKR